ncbi:hypothetical protein V2J09_011691 [Rumex salicifolius]
MFRSSDDLSFELRFDVLGVSAARDILKRRLYALQVSLLSEASMAVDLLQLCFHMIGVVVLVARTGSRDLETQYTHHQD